jgi:hypothetical protein
MDYQQIYDNIIQRAKNLNRKKGYGVYYEKHHILPKCLKGTNDNSNLVLLTAKEHYICHLLLTNIYPESDKLAYALWTMIRGNNLKQSRYIPSSRAYESARIHLGNTYKGKPAWNKGIKLTEDQLKRHATRQPGYTVWNKGKKGIYVCSEETKQKMSIASKNRPPMSAETKKKISDAAARKRETKPIIIKPTRVELNKAQSERMKANPNRCRKGAILSEEIRKKISESSKNRPPISEETRNKMKAAHAKRKANLNTLIIN